MTKIVQNKDGSVTYSLEGFDGEAVSVSRTAQPHAESKVVDAPDKADADAGSKAEGKAESKTVRKK